VRWLLKMFVLVGSDRIKISLDIYLVSRISRMSGLISKRNKGKEITGLADRIIKMSAQDKSDEIHGTDG